MSEMKAEAEAATPSDPVADVTVETVAPDLTLWSEAHCFAIPDGAILTLVHTIPIFNGEGDVIGLTKKPIVHYSMSNKVLAGSAAMLIQQAIAGAAQYGESGAKEEVEELLMKAIEDGRSRAESIMQQLAEREEGDNGQ